MHTQTNALASLLSSLGFSIFILSFFCTSRIHRWHTSPACPFTNDCNYPSFLSSSPTADSATPRSSSTL